ncbi:10582_t:CDS:2, partial [Diversispora eburnea]
QSLSTDAALVQIPNILQHSILYSGCNKHDNIRSGCSQLSHHFSSRVMIFAANSKSSYLDQNCARYSKLFSELIISNIAREIFELSLSLCQGSTIG